MHGPRIGYGAQPKFSPGDWAADTRYSISERQNRMSTFVRHFEEYPLRALQDLGEQLSVSHNLGASNHKYSHAAALGQVSLDRYLWREGIHAEATSTRNHTTPEALGSLT